jgi:hypothetical protein
MCVRMCACRDRCRDKTVGPGPARFAPTREPRRLAANAPQAYGAIIHFGHFEIIGASRDCAQAIHLTGDACAVQVQQYQRSKRLVIDHVHEVGYCAQRFASQIANARLWLRTKRDHVGPSRKLHVFCTVLILGVRTKTTTKIVLIETPK